jgi:hypothetical protein
MTPRCFFAIGGIGPRRIDGEIFSNVKTGMVYPLVDELKHSWNLLQISFFEMPDGKSFWARLIRALRFKHNICQIAADLR